MIIDFLEKLRPLVAMCANAPLAFVKEMKDAGMFYTNRVLKDWKEKDRKHVEKTRPTLKTFEDLTHCAQDPMWSSR